MDNNNGRGIFYGVIGVATLIVAIIGATFAYFSASINSGQVVNTGSTSLDLTFTPNETVNAVGAGMKMDLIPIDTDGAGVKAEGTSEDNSKDTANNQAAFATRIGGGATDCKDLVGNSICSVYEFKIGNPSEASAQTIYGYLQAPSSTLTDLHYAVFVGSAADLKSAEASNPGVFDVHGTESNAETIISDSGSNVGLIHKATLASTLATGSESTDEQKWTPIKGSTKLLNPLNKGTAENPNEITYTIVLWLEETYISQESQEGQTFTAEIMFNTGFGSGVTGQLSLS